MRAIKKRLLFNRNQSKSEDELVNAGPLGEKNTHKDTIFGRVEIKKTGFSGLFHPDPPIS